MTEPELFAAYRVEYGYATECACGTIIHVVSADVTSVTEAIAFHNLSTVHAQWRAWREALGAVEPTKHPCPCHDHGAAA